MVISLVHSSSVPRGEGFRDRPICPTPYNGHRELLSAPSSELRTHDQLHRCPIPASRDSRGYGNVESQRARFPHSHTRYRLIVENIQDRGARRKSAVGNGRNGGDGGNGFTTKERRRTKTHGGCHAVSTGASGEVCGWALGATTPTVTGRVAGRNGRRVVMRGRRDLEHGLIRPRARDLAALSSRPARCAARPGLRSSSLTSCEAWQSSPSP